MSAPTQTPNGAGDARDPSGFLSEIIGAPVTVKLNSGVVYKGMAFCESSGVFNYIDLYDRRASVR